MEDVEVLFEVDNLEGVLLCSDDGTFNDKHC